MVLPEWYLALAKDKLEAPREELERQNKLIEEESEMKTLEEKAMKEGTADRFNAAMQDVNKKLVRQSNDREQRDA